MGHPSSTRTESACRSAAPGHLPPAAGADPGLLADAAGWVPVTVLVDPPAQALVLACPSGTRWTGYHHGVGTLAAALRCDLPTPGHDAGTTLPLVGSAVCHWHPAAGVLGLPADPRLRAGRAYLELSAVPLEPCRLVHDPVLAAAFAAVTGTPARR